MGAHMILKPAGSLEKYLPLFIKQQRKTALDYGSGNLRNSLYLCENGFEVVAVDRPGQKKIVVPGLTFISPEELQSLKINVNIALCTFVLSLLTGGMRALVFDRLAEKTAPEGYLLIETKGLALPELDLLAVPRGFARVDTRTGRYTLIALYQFHKWRE